MKFRRWMMLVSSMVCVFMSCLPPHVQYLDQLCAFMGGAGLTMLMTDLAIANLFNMEE